MVRGTSHNGAANGASNVGGSAERVPADTGTDEVRAARATARMAGLLYLLAGLTGVFSYLYVPATLVVPGNATATAGRIADGMLIYRFGIMSDLASQIFLMLLALVLYGLFSHVHRKYARVMVGLVLVGAAAGVADVFNLLGPLVLWGGADFLAVFTVPQRDALAMGFLGLRTHALFVVQVFWGLWLLPFGLLVIKCGFMPKALGYLLVVACLAYLSASIAHFFAPAHAHLVARLMQPLEGLGEATAVIWLLAKGVSAAPSGGAAVSRHGTAAPRPVADW